MLGRAFAAALCALALGCACLAAEPLRHARSRRLNALLSQGHAPGLGGLWSSARRQLKQDNATVPKCQWTDEWSGCFLDYFNLIPEGDLKDVYRTDENCSKITMQSECRELEECTWEAGCVVFLEDKIAECNAESGDPPSGSLCDFFVVSSKCQAFAELEKNCTDAGCDWKMDDQNGFCTASQEMILNVELAMAPELIPKISAELKRCNESTTVEECEDSQGAMG